MKREYIFTSFLYFPILSKISIIYIFSYFIGRTTGASFLEQLFAYSKTNRGVKEKENKYSESSVANKSEHLQAS